uniref:Uncharacterized protein n=1 Tax=Arundo donax TaxID=35708 RepID=A0A0A9DP62_ARUDO
MAARAPLVMPHAAASASRRPAMAPLASSLTAPCRRARGPRGFQQRTRRVRLLRPPAAAKSEAIGSTAEAAPVEGLTRKLQGGGDVRPERQGRACR